MINLNGKRILITGASSGIGRAVSQQVAALGGRLVMLDRNTVNHDETSKLLHENEHRFFRVDVTDYNHVEQIIRSTVAENGPISGFVHSAGIEKTLPVKASTPEVFKEIFEINVFAGFEIARIISQKKIFNDQGTSFVFISSIRGKFGEAGLLAYCSSKGALLSGAKAMALELAPKNIRCNCVLPGIVETEMVKNFFDAMPIEAKERVLANYPLGFGKPSDIAYLISFLLSDEARWITGSDFVADGGYTAH
jgi:NAD(P)-dependent dehydrogenase (short-subunit alcohol dehydrogenase family)